MDGVSRWAFAEAIAGHLLGQDEPASSTWASLPGGGSEASPVDHLDVHSFSPSGNVKGPD